MTILAFSILLIFFSILAGLLGALTGLGGGVVIIPVLVLFFHINLHLAMGASLISVIATSSGATIAYMRAGYTNLRIGLFLTTSAVVGALIGALLVTIVSKAFIAILFSIVMFFSAYLTLRRKEGHDQFTHSHPLANELKLNSTYPSKKGVIRYSVQNPPLAFFISGISGLISGLLGIGSGSLHVLAMDQAMRIPYKVAMTTSNFMIGITAAASAGIYFSQGYIDPIVTFPVMIGVLLGSFLGAKILKKMHNRLLRIIFSLIICIIGLQMLYKVFWGTL